MSREHVDTRVTAYVFGELSPEDVAAFEQELQQSSELREEVDSIRETIVAVKSDLAVQSTDIGGPQREAILDAIEQNAAPQVSPLDPTPPPVEVNAGPQIDSNRRWLSLAAPCSKLIDPLHIGVPLCSRPQFDIDA